FGVGSRDPALCQGVREVGYSNAAHHALPPRQHISDSKGHGVLRSILKAAVHHAARRRCGWVAARGELKVLTAWTAVNWRGRAEPERLPRGLLPPPARRDDDPDEA